MTQTVQRESNNLTLDFSSLDSIVDYQLFSQTKGILLVENNTLFEFNGNNIKEINAPKGINITKVHFLNSTEGAVGGYFANSHQEKASFMSGTLLIWLLMLFILAFKLKDHIKKIIIILLVPFLACKTTSSHAENESSLETTKKVELSTGFHKYFANKKYVRPVISITKNGGRTWETNALPTNFYITDLAFENRTYLISTFANPYDNIKNRPIHGDGDLWLYDSQSFSKEYRPSSFSNHFGVNGIETGGGEIYLYGTERTKSLFKKNQLKGNITRLDESLQNDFLLIDTPYKTAVTSMSVNDGIIWCVLDNKQEIIANHEIHYEFVSKRKLVSYRGGSWVESALPEEPKEVTFQLKGENGFIISESGNLYSTIDKGTSWGKMSNICNITKGKRFSDFIAFLSRENHIVIFENLI